MNFLTAVQRAGKAAYFDPIRKIIVAATAEEAVRQEVMRRLVLEWNLSPSDLRVEEPMTRHQKGVRGRADVVVLLDAIPWILFECKAPGVPVDDDALDQALRYNDTLGSDYVCITNGDRSRWFLMDYNEAGTEYDPIEIEAPGHVNDLLEGTLQSLERQEFVRPTLAECHSTELAREYLEQQDVIGCDTPSHLHPFIINLDGLLMQDTSLGAIGSHLEGMTVVEDGKRETKFGNAGGGSYDGTYRYFLLRDGSNEHTVVSLAFMATMKTENDPWWGTLKGKTYLIVAIDDFERRHSSLQLNVDLNVKLTDHSWEIWHDGRLASGHKGSVPRKEVVDHMKSTLPDLVEGNRIHLGSLPLDELFTPENSGRLLANLIRYAIERDRVRERWGR